MLGWFALWFVACFAVWTWQEHRLRRRYAVVGLDLAGLVALLPETLRDRQYLYFIVSPNSDRTLLVGLVYAVPYIYRGRPPHIGLEFDAHTGRLLAVYPEGVNLGGIK